MPEYKKVKGVPRKEALGMDEIVPMFIRALRLDAGLNTRRVFAAWDSVSGAKDYTLRKFYRDGKLYVTLSSSMVRTHLEFQKEALVPALNAFLEKDELFSSDRTDRVGFVKEIIFK